MTQTNKLTASLLVEIPARFPNIRCWRSNVLNAMVTGRDGKPRMVRAGVKGQGDISGIIGPGGQRLEIEVKWGRDTQNVNQMGFEAMIREHGGVYIIARDVEGCLEALKPLGRAEELK